MEAVDGAISWKEVCDRLELTPGGSTRERLRRRCLELGLDTSHIGVASPGSDHRRWTDAQLVEVVAQAENLHGVFVALGLRPGGEAWLAMKEHIRRLELDLSHWNPRARAVVLAPGRRAPTWTDAELRDASLGARSVAEVMRRLGLDPVSNRGRREIVRRLRELGVDPAAFAGRAWAGGTAPDRRASRRPLEEILVRDSTYRTSSLLKERLLEAELLHPWCACCGVEEWNGTRLVLHLDHINGERSDNRLANLRLLCPNCHSQTETYCGRNIGGGYAPTSEPG
jgi:hypothetical protein